MKGLVKMKNNINVESYYKDTDEQIFQHIFLENNQYLIKTKAEQKEIIVLDHIGFHYANEDEMNLMNQNKKYIEIQSLFCERNKQLKTNYIYFENRIENKKSFWTFNDLLNFQKH